MSNGILKKDDAVPPAGAATGAKDPVQAWKDTAARFLAAVPYEQREAVEPLLQQPHYGSSGLRNWIDAIASQGAVLPERIPAAVIDVYLEDAEAMPLYECEECGLAVPVRPNRLLGPDAEPEKVFFPECPACGGRTGYYLYRTRDSVSQLRHTKPR
jgi:hypothetical protein